MLFTTMLNTLTTPFAMWVVGPNPISALSPIFLPPESATAVDPNFIAAWLAQNIDQNVVVNLQVYPIGFQPALTSTSIGGPQLFAGAGVGPQPVVTSIYARPFNTFNLVAGEIVGFVTATNSPTSWSITNGTGVYFAIDQFGDITVTASGTQLSNTTGTQTLTVVATNAFGSGSGTVVLNLTATVPLFASSFTHNAQGLATLFINQRALFASSTIFTRAATNIRTTQQLIAAAATSMLTSKLSTALINPRVMVGLPLSKISARGALSFPTAVQLVAKATTQLGGRVLGATLTANPFTPPPVAPLAGPTSTRITTTSQLTLHSLAPMPKVMFTARGLLTLKAPKLAATATVQVTGQPSTTNL